LSCAKLGESYSPIPMSDIKTLQETLEKKQAELAKLGEELKVARAKQFTDLPEKVGLGSVDSLIKALADFASPRFKGILRAAFNGGTTRATKKVSAPSSKKAGKRTRAKITPEIRKSIEAAAKEGKMTGAEIAKEFGVSLPSVANIKKAAGLTKKRAKS
jgi:DNA-binding phage protein